jgi:hypothetical protein
MREPSYQKISVVIRKAAEDVLTKNKAGADTVTAVHEVIALSMKEANMPVKEYSTEVIKKVNEALQKTNAVSMVPEMDAAITKAATSFKIEPEPQQPDQPAYPYSNRNLHMNFNQKQQQMNQEENFPVHPKLVQNKNGWGNEYPNDPITYENAPVVIVNPLQPTDPNYNPNYPNPITPPKKV